MEPSPEVVPSASRVPFVPSPGSNDKAAASAVRPGPMFGATPSTSAKTARAAVLAHAAESQARMRGVGLLEAPASSSSATKASAVLAEMEAHLSQSGVKTQRWKNFGEAPWRQSAFGPRSSPEHVHVQLLRREISELEHFANRDMIPRLEEQKAELIRERNALRESSDRRIAELQSELAQAQHQGWQGRETVAQLERNLSAKQDEVSRLSAAHATESGRAAALETSLAELRQERDDAVQAMAAELSRRTEAEAQLREAEREIRLNRERLEEQARSHASQLAERDRLAEQHAAQSADQIAAMEEQSRELEQQIADVQLSLTTEAAERSVAERAAEQREAALKAQLDDRDRALEREAASRREVEATLSGVREALTQAAEAAREAGERASTGDERREALLAELEAAKASLAESMRARSRQEDLLALAREETSLANEKANALSVQLSDAERTRDVAAGAESALRGALADADGRARNAEAHARAISAAADEVRARLEADVAALREELDSAQRSAAQAEQMAGVVERQAAQRITQSESKTAREARAFVVGARRREQAAKTEARRLRNSLYESDAALQAIWSEAFARQESTSWSC